MSMLKRNNRFALILLVLFIAAIPWILGRVISWRIYHNVQNRFGNQYAIVAANQNGKAGVAFNMYRTSAHLLYTYFFPPVPQGSGHFTGTRHHLIVLISNNKLVEIGTWSFRSFSLEFDNHGIEIAAMDPTLMQFYQYKEVELINFRGLRIKNIGKPPGVSFYIPGWSLSRGYRPD